MIAFVILDAMRTAITADENKRGYTDPFIGLRIWPVA
jgi:hypothetical protein